MTFHGWKPTRETALVGAAARKRISRERADSIVMSQEKACANCLLTKPFAEFPVRYRAQLTGRHSWCGSCTAKKGRTAKLRNFYNLTDQDYETILSFQGGVCAICRRPPVSKRHAVDHDHKTGLIRGLCCAKCNRIIGSLRDSPVLAMACAEFLRNPTATTALGAPRYGIKGRTSNKAATRKRLNKVVAP
jgi:hypothetical protein